MEKIVVLSSQTKVDNTLIKCLKMLFPECEIEVQPQKPKVPRGRAAIAETYGKNIPEAKNRETFMSTI